MKGTFLILESDFTGHIKNGEIKNGKVVIDNREYILSIPIEKEKEGKKVIEWRDVPPIIVKGGGLLSPEKKLWILKWSSLFPVGFMVDEKKKEYLNPENPSEKITVNEKELQVVVPQFKDTKKLLPEILASTGDLRFLKSMKTYAGGGGIDMKKVLPILIIIFVIGVIGYIWYYYFAKKG